MDRIVVTSLGALAWSLSIWIIVRLRATRRAGPPLDGGAAAAIGRVAGGVAAAMVAGVLVLGLGGRLMMRVLAATSGPSAQGRLTEAEEVVGDVTMDGTLSLVLFVGLAGGLVGLLLFGPLRRWLPARSLAAGLVTAGIGAGLVARPSDLLNPSNRDFTILEPTWLAVTLAVGLILTFSLLGAALIDRWSASWPPPGRSVKGAAGVLPLVPLLLAPPVAVATAAAIGFGAYVRPRLVNGRWLGPVDRVLRIAALVAAAAGCGWVLLAVGEIIG